MDLLPTDSALYRVDMFLYEGRCETFVTPFMIYDGTSQRTAIASIANGDILQTQGMRHEKNESNTHNIHPKSQKESQKKTHGGK